MSMKYKYLKSCRQEFDIFMQGYINSIVREAQNFGNISRLLRLSILSTNTLTVKNIQSEVKTISRIKKLQILKLNLLFINRLIFRNNRN